MINAINKQLVKDYKFPIPVTDEPYFSHYAELLSGFYRVHAAKNQLIDMCDREGGFEAALGNTRKLIASVVDHVRAKTDFHVFGTMDMGAFQGVKAPEKQALYQRDNVGMDFIALDMKKANFQALRSVFPSLVDHHESWEGFIGQFTNEIYYQNCKQIRQVLFGQLNPKRQQTIMKHRMAKIFSELVNNGIEEAAVFSSSPDEIVISYSQAHEGVCRELLSQPEVAGGLHMDVFTLELAHPEKPFFLKRHKDKEKLELKSVPKFYVPEVIRHLKGEGPQSMDRFFMHEGRLCQYSEPLY